MWLQSITPLIKEALTSTPWPQIRCPEDNSNYQVYLTLYTIKTSFETGFFGISVTSIHMTAVLVPISKTAGVFPTLYDKL